MTTPAEAEAAIAGHMPAQTTETIPLTAAAGRILASPATAERDQPPFDRVTMDGVALRFADIDASHKRLKIAGTIAAGAATAPPIPPGACVEIMTGAVMPAAADTVVPVERTSKAGGIITIAPDAAIECGQFIHRQGSDRRAGDTLLPAGARIGAAEIAVLASAGYGQVTVVRCPNVAVISTGDELVGLDDQVEPHQIRSSNDFAIAAALESRGLARVSRHRLRDDRDKLLATIGKLHQENDALVLSGGVSMGQFDFVPAVLEALGCELVFHRIEQKPGRPMWFGVSRDRKPVFALPGNPVSTLLCTVRYVLPAFTAAAGAIARPALRYPLSESVRAPKHLTYFVPVVLKPHGDRIVAEPRPTNTSGDFATLAGTDGFIELPPGWDEHPAGAVGPLIPW